MWVPTKNAQSQASEPHAPERIFHNHGRGILLARWETFDKVEYQGTGNRVVMEITHGNG